MPHSSPQLPSRATTWVRLFILCSLTLSLLATAFGQARPTNAQGPTSWTDTTRNDFSTCSVLTNTSVANTNGGEVRLVVQRPTGEVETLTVKIPAGIESGKKIRLRGQGEPGPRGGPAGDLIVVVRVRPHPFFERKGSDLEVRVPVTLAEAALGAKIDIPTPKGTISLTVPPRTSSGRRLRVKGYGVPSADGKPGDLFAWLRSPLSTRKIIGHVGFLV